MIRKGKLIILLSFFSILFLFGAETLRIDFSDAGGSKTLPGGTLQIPSAVNGWLIRGKEGLAIPAKELVGSEEGTMLVRFKLERTLDRTQKQRNIMTLRCRSRNRIALYIARDSTTLRFYAGDYDKKIYFQSPVPIAFGKEHVAAIAWGNGRIRFHLDGVLLEDTSLPLPMERLDALHLGPYKDRYTSMVPGDNDIYFKQVFTFDNALPPAEIAKLSGAVLKSAVEANPGLLSVPVEQKDKPVLDGKVNEDFWRRAASIPVLVNLYNRKDSFKAPQGRFMISADSGKLYIGMRYVFPPGNTINQGQVRTAATKPEVWGSESFEFFLQVNGKPYRFAGNVAGGSTERRASEREWTAPWEYKSSLTMLIDNSQIWEAEAAIPWSSFDLKGIPAGELPFNFGRSWTITDFSGATALNPDGSYWIKEDISPRIRFDSKAPAALVKERNNPSGGALRQSMTIYSPVAGKVNYEIAMLTADGSAMPIPVFTKTLTMKAGEIKELDIDAKLSPGVYDTLRYTLSMNGKPCTRNLIPFKLDEIFLEAHPRFFSGQIDVELRLAMIKGKFGSEAAAALKLLDPAGKEIWSGAVSGEKMTIPFDHNKQAAGLYNLAVADKAGKVSCSIKLNYPGIGDWAKIKYDKTVIIPPFTPLVTKGKTFATWGREYRYGDSIFPDSIKTQGNELFKAAPEIIADGKAADGAGFTPGSSADHRAEYTSAVRHPAFNANANSFVEYDGISYSKIKLTANQNLNGLKLRFTLDEAYAKYLHASNGSAWGTKTTCALKPGANNLAFYPMVWLGDEEQGICFFTETRKNWTGPKNAMWTITKENGKALVEVSLKTKMSKGETFDFEFGYIATPVKPHVSNFPLDILGCNHTPMMRRPGHAHVNYLSVFSHYNGSVNFFNDMPTEETWHDRVMGTPQMKWRKIAKNKISAYMASRCISDEYPEMQAYKDEWRVAPGIVLPYTQEGKKITLYETCPTTLALDFFTARMKRYVERFKVDSIYFDFGVFGSCSNRLHGCDGRWPILAMREFHRRTALILYEAGIKEPLVVLHNTDCVQIPAMTFVTHLFNGEHVRQASSTLYHDGKDIQDGYDLPMFACELSSLPFGLTNSVYNPVDPLLKQYGGGKEPTELYRFRITQAFMAAMLPHGTIIAQNRSHYGIIEKVVRQYERFGVGKARFIGYWKNPAKVEKGKNIFVSIYRHPAERKALAVISHIARNHDDQDISIVFDAEKLGFTPNKAVDLLTQDDPDYQLLYKLRKDNRISPSRAPLDLGDFGSKLNNCSNGRIEMRLKHHTFALVELSE